MRITGGCHCENILYEAEADEKGVGICHCTDCQKLSAAAYRIVIPANENNFILLKNKPKIYIKKSDNGAPRIQAFCSECGSHIYATSTQETDNRTFNIRLGTVDNNRGLIPQKQIWCRSAQSWTFNLNNIPKIEKQT